MGLITEDGTGLPGAESYASVTTADTYHNARSNTGWTGEIDVKERALRRATEYMDIIYVQVWRGWRNTKDQGLDWPRFNVVDRDGFVIGSDEVPKVLERATVEMALRALIEELLPDIDEPGTIKRERIALPGGLEVDTSYFGRSQIKKYRRIDLMIGEIIEPRQVVERG